jgi:hypothetical protein
LAFVDSQLHELRSLVDAGKVKKEVFDQLVRLQQIQMKQPQIGAAAVSRPEAADADGRRKRNSLFKRKSKNRNKGSTQVWQ